MTTESFATAGRNTSGSLIAAVLQMPKEDCAEFLELREQKKAALDAANIRDGGSQQVLTDAVDASSLSEK